MKKNHDKDFEHVYCTDCEHLSFNGKTATCPYENKCDISYYKDSEARIYRPMYKEKSVNY